MSSEQTKKKINPKSKASQKNFIQLKGEDSQNSGLDRLNVTANLDSTGDQLKLKVLNNKLNMQNLEKDKNQMRVLAKMGKEFLNDADENDKKQYQKIMKNRVKKQQRLTKDELMFGIVPEKFKKTDTEIMNDINCEKAHAQTSNLTKSHVLRHQTAKEATELIYGQKDEDKTVGGQIKTFILGSENRSCQDRLVITMDSHIYQFWKIFVVIVCVLSSLTYAEMAAFGLPSSDSWLFIATLVFEVIFVVDMIVQFTLEFKPEDQYNTVRDLTEIAKRYLRGRFLIDFIALIPLQYMFVTKHAHLFLLIKIVRLQ